MKRVPFSKQGPSVSIIGLGCMGMSGMYGPADRAECLATVVPVAHLKNDFALSGDARSQAIAISFFANLIARFSAV